MNSYKDSFGNRYSQSIINRKITEAKAKKLREQNDEYGFNFCTECQRNDCVPIDCSHDVSVADCKKQGRVELSWDTDNISIIGRSHHQVKDKLNLQFTK